jgi:uncharacterized membrane protein YdbT with pleckstrin-like domain
MAAEQQEVILIKPAFKAFVEYIAAGVIMLFYGGIGIFVLLGVWYYTASRKYEVSTEKITIERGLVMKKTQTLNIGRIKDVIVRQGPLQKPFNVGDVRILHNDKTLPILILKGITYPVEFKALLSKYNRDLRKNREKATAQQETLRQAMTSPDQQS